MADQQSILVVSAHAADFVRRAGGAVALYVSRGYRVRILCLSFGECGESQGAWKQTGMTIGRVKEIRREEFTRAIRHTQEAIDAMVAEYRELQPDLGKRRGVQAVRNGGHKKIKYAEAFQRVYPQVTSELS
jgi:hypothetical protein